MQIHIIKCGMRNAERGTASLRFTSLTRIDIKCGARNGLTECGVRSAERGTASFRLRFTHKDRFSFMVSSYFS